GLVGGRGDEQPAERALVDEPQLVTAVGEREAHSQVLLRGCRRRHHQQLTAHAEVADQDVRRVQRQPEVLAAPADGLYPATGEPGHQVGGAGDVAAHRAGMEGLDGGERAAVDPAVEALPDDLDLGQLGHPPAYGVVSVSGGGALSRRVCQATSAACCSASFLLRPSPVPSDRPPTTAVALNDLQWSGPSSSTTYSGTPSICWAVSSCSEVFQSRPAPRVADSAISGSKSRWTNDLARSMPPERYTAPMSASSASARI